MFFSSSKKIVVFSSSKKIVVFSSSKKIVVKIEFLIFYIVFHTFIIKYNLFFRSSIIIANKKNAKLSGIVLFFSMFKISRVKKMKTNYQMGTSIFIWELIKQCLIAYWWKKMRLSLLCKLIEKFGL